VGHRSSLLQGSLSVAGTRFESKLAGPTPQGRTCTGRADTAIEKIARQAAAIDAAAQDDAAATALSSPHAFSKAIDPPNGALCERE
jgi:hypothetical protein